MAYSVLRQTIMPLFLRRLQVMGFENLQEKPPYIIVANHVSYLDGPMIGLVLAVKANTRAHYLTHKSIARWFGRLIGEKFLGMIPIPPEKKSQAVELAIAQLKQGKNIGIFPEATRNYDTSNLLKGKTGAARLALATGLPLIPIGVIAPPLRTISGALKAFFFTRWPLGVVIGKPIRFTPPVNQEINKEYLEGITREIMQAIGRLCHKNYSF